MDPETTLARCSKCGKEAPRGEMFGLEPDLLCDACAHQVRKRTAPKAVGRLANAFVGRPTPATMIILVAALGLYVVQHLVLRNDRSAWPDWFWALTPANFRTGGSIWTGQWWRLITTTLLHAGVFHVAFNCYWVWVLGRATEGARGTGVFLLVFVGSAAFASALQAFVSPSWAVGLSGALYGLASYLWMRRREDAVAASAMNPSTTRLLFVWFIICWPLSAGDDPILRVANWAHAGGLVWGLAAGWISLQEEKGTRIAGAAALLAATVAASWWVTSGHIL